jgi:hypothetical protein
MTRTTYYTVSPDEGTPEGSAVRLYARRSAAERYARKLLENTDSGQVTISKDNRIEYLYRVDCGEIVHEVESND